MKINLGQLHFITDMGIFWRSALQGFCWGAGLVAAAVAGRLTAVLILGAIR